MSLANLAMPSRHQHRWVYAVIWCMVLGCGLVEGLDGGSAWAASGRLGAPGNPAAARPFPKGTEMKAESLLIGLGDSLTHGTMDATNNAINTVHAYLQGIAAALTQVSVLHFSQPLFDGQERRLWPLRVPINLGVEGVGIFSLEGISYYKRAGVATSFITEGFGGENPTFIPIPSNRSRQRSSSACSWCYKRHSNKVHFPSPPIPWPRSSAI